MRFFLGLALTFFALSAPCAFSQDKEAEGEEKITLKVGDTAPQLAATKWVAGKEVKTFEPGKFYVVEFWATWCGPCVVMMPHLGDLQQELGPKGVTIIGFSAAGPGNTPEQIETFVKKRGEKLGYSIAYAENEETYDAYMKASGNGGIPCSYVIGKDGKIAYIGHPLFLDEVLPKVLDGTWEPASGTAALKSADKLWDETYAAIAKPAANPEEIEKQLAKWEEFNSKWPKLATDPYMNTARLNLYVVGKRYDDAAKLAESILTKAATRNDISAYGSVATAFTAKEAVGQKNLVAIGLRAAEEGMKLDGETLPSLLRIAKANAAAGEIGKAKEYGVKAIAAAEKAIHGDKDIMGTLQLASAYAAAGDKENAKLTAEKAVSITGGNNEGMRDYVEEQAKKYGAEIKKPEPKKEKKEQK